MAGIDLKSFLSLLPQTVLLVWASLLLLVDLFIPKNKKAWTAILAGIGLLISLILILLEWGHPSLTYNNMAVVDNFAVYLNVLFAVSGLVAIAIAYDYLNRMGIQRGEYYSLLMFSISGMMLMASAADLIMFFLALELLSIPAVYSLRFCRSPAGIGGISIEIFHPGCIFIRFCALRNIADLWRHTLH